MVLASPRFRPRPALRGFANVHGRRLETALIVPEDLRPRAPHLVFLHGAFGSLSAWNEFPAEAARASRCPALVYSRAGHGRSDARAGPARPDLLQVEAQSVLPALLDAQGIERPLLVGHEDGAAIALIHAGSAFDVAGIVALSPRMGVDEPAISAVQGAQARFAAGDGMPAFARLHRDPGALLERWAMLWASPAFRTRTLAPYLAHVQAPVLLIQGEDDEQANLADLAALASELRGRATTMQLQAVGHAPWEDAPRAIAAAIASLVDRTLAR